MDASERMGLFEFSWLDAHALKLSWAAWQNMSQSLDSLKELYKGLYDNMGKDYKGYERGY